MVVEKKYHLPRKPLSPEEAKMRLQKRQQQLGNLQEDILYWRVRIGKPLQQIDNFILMAGKYKTALDAIAGDIEEINKIEYEITNYIKKYI